MKSILKHGGVVLLRAGIGFFVFAITWAILTLAYWLYAPYTVATLEQPIKVLNPNNEVVPGRAIDLLIVVSKTGDFEAEKITRGLSCPNGSFYAVTPQDSAISLPVGEFQRVRSFKLDELTPTGLEKCKFIFRLEYQVNPVRTVVETWVSENISTVEGQ